MSSCQKIKNPIGSGRVKFSDKEEKDLLGKPLELKFTKMRLNATEIR